MSYPTVITRASPNLWKLASGGGFTDRQTIYSSSAAMGLGNYPGNLAFPPRRLPIFQWVAMNLYPNLPLKDKAGLINQLS